MNKNKYITKEEKDIIEKNIQVQIDELKKEINDPANFIIKKELENVGVMMEEGEIDGYE